ncbi:ABC transporter substrate-binding protein [Streptomyces sp. CRN 30]|uniref:ABC transporter substrate-binding protein n=1 Tax=Streptomyces sp. CRN 30 TaxID=3075613 RepID=UPI002A820284|nr:ABC transporter substrate-binding protein [Streptomyces sp. CRN 30]
MRVTALGAAVLILAAATGCGSSNDSDDGAEATKTTKVRVGIIPIVDVAPLYLGEKMGFFGDHGIDVETVAAQGGAAIVPSVVSGQFQFGFSNTTSLMIAQTKGVPVKSVANGAASNGQPGGDVTGVVVGKDSPLESAKELEGQKVAVNALKNIGDTTVRESVRLAGGDPSKVKFVEIPFDQMPAALADGRVDAAWMGEPSQTLAKAQGARVIASPFAETDPRLTVATYFTSSKLQQENPELVKNFAAAMRESLDYARANPEEARKILTEYTKIDAETRAHLMLPAWVSEVNMPSLEKLAELGEKDGLFGEDGAGELDLEGLFG